MISNQKRSKDKYKNQMDVSVTIQENIVYAKKGYVWNLSTCACENNRFSKCYAYKSYCWFNNYKWEIINTTKTMPLNSNDKKFISNHNVKNCYYLLLLHKTLVKTMSHITILPVR